MNTCTVENCGQKTRYKLYCSKHQQRMIKYGTTDDRPRPARKACSLADCASLAIAHGFCNKHLKRWKAYGDPHVRYQGGIAARPVTERFFEHFTPAGDDCWEWQGTISVYGYGVIGEVVGGKLVQHKAHRLSYEIHKGPIPDGLQMCHTCDNRRCVNPGHLYAGTVQDNARDKVVRNRIKGERHSMAKLTNQQAREIARLYATGDYRQQELGDLFGVSQAVVSKIVLGTSGYITSQA